MDKFEQQIVKAKRSYEPTSNFVEETMNRLQTQSPRRHWRLSFWAPALAGVVALIAIVFIAVPKATNRQVEPKATSPHASTPLAPAQPALTPGSDNTSLDSDLTSIQNAMNQSGSDQSGADNALNDNQSQITVPTD